MMSLGGRSPAAGPRVDDPRMKSPDILVGDRPGGARGRIPDHPADPAGVDPLSIGLVSPAWPPDAYPNGIVSYVAALAEGLRALGHRVTILVPWPAPGD